MNIYKVFICHHGRESGSYYAEGKTYTEAALHFAKHSNICLRSEKYGAVWRKSYRKKKGNPKFHSYLKDEKGNTLLLILSIKRTKQ